MVNHEAPEACDDVKQVQLNDLDNAAHLPGGRRIRGMLAGNEIWRSIEAHLKSELHKPTDMFSFGLVVRLSVTNQTRD